MNKALKQVQSYLRPAIRSVELDSHSHAELDISKDLFEDLAG